MKVWEQKLNNGHQAAAAELLHLRCTAQLSGWRALTPPVTAQNLVAPETSAVFFRRLDGDL